MSDEYNRDAFPAMNFNAGKQLGFIAQEVEKFLPELVHTDSNGYKSVTYTNVIPVLVEAVKTQQKQKSTASLGNRLENLEAENTQLKFMAGKAHRVQNLENSIRR